LENILFSIFLIVALALFVFIAFAIGEERKELRANAYQEGIGEEYDLELKRLLELQSFRPKDAPSGPDPYREALDIVRLRKRTMAKSLPPHLGEKTIFNISNSTIANLNLGTVLGDLNASVQNLQTHGSQQIPDTIGKLTTVINESIQIRDADRKDLLENLALVSKEVSSQPDQRRPGLLKSPLDLSQHLSQRRRI
jgi:hypothetical protein